MTVFDVGSQCLIFFSAKWYLNLMVKILFVDLFDSCWITGDLFNKLPCHIHGGSGSMSIHKMSVLVSLLGDIFWNFTVLTNFDSSVNIHMKSNFLFRISLHDVMRDNIKIILNHIPETQRVSNLKQNIINWPQINILDPMLVHMPEYSSVFHLSINGTVSAWRQWHLTLGLDDDLSVVTDSGDTSLGEENYWVWVVAEVVVGFEVGADLLVVHLAGHDVPFDHVRWG